MCRIIGQGFVVCLNHVFSLDHICHTGACSGCAMVGLLAVSPVWSTATEMSVRDLTVRCLNTSAVFFY